MKIKAKITKKKATKKPPPNQKLLIEFIFDNIAKKDIKINSNKKIEDKQVIDVSQKKEDDLTRPKENLIQNQNITKLSDKNKQNLLIGDKYKLIENRKKSSLFEKDIKEKERIFPIRLQTKL